MDAGLESVVAAETVLSDVDGAHGRLVIRGLAVEELAANMTFEETVHLLWNGFFEDLPDRKILRSRLAEARQVAFDLAAAHHSDSDPIVSLRLNWSRLPDDESLDTAILVAAAAPVFTAMAIRRAAGLDLLAPNPNLRQAEDFLYMLTGTAPDPALARALDAYLVTVSDHGLNASTFTARVVASTRAGLTSAAIGGLCALKGPLHGGAPGPVLDMLDAIGDAENAEAWIEGALARKERLMGFGHRIYRVRDPRADALKTAIQQLPGTAGRLAFAQHIEREVLSKLAEKYPTRQLDTNVEFYTALLLEALEIPREAFTAVFACGRCLGWIGHAQEQIATGRIIRPKSVYKGPAAVPA